MHLAPLEQDKELAEKNEMNSKKQDAIASTSSKDPIDESSSDEGKKCILYVESSYLFKIKFTCALDSVLSAYKYKYSVITFQIWTHLHSQYQKAPLLVTAWIQRTFK
jgi:hypothetical protein